MVVFWLAHIYADGVARQLGRAGPGSRRDPCALQARSARADGSGAGDGALALGWIGVLSRETAVELAIGLGVVLLAGWGYVIARRARLSRWETAGSIALNGAIGLAIVGMKVWIH